MEKKRFRPTLTAYRALENEVSKFKEMNARLVRDNQSLVDKNATLDQSNKLMEFELKRLREANEQLSKMNKNLRRECQYLQSRGFWKRLFNK